MRETRSLPPRSLSSPRCARFLPLSSGAWSWWRRKKGRNVFSDMKQNRGCENRIWKSRISQPLFQYYDYNHQQGRWMTTIFFNRWKALVKSNLLLHLLLGIMRKEVIVPETEHADRALKTSFREGECVGWWNCSCTWIKGWPARFGQLWLKCWDQGKSFILIPTIQTVSIGYYAFPINTFACSRR